MPNLIIHGTNGITYPDSTVQESALTTGAQVIDGVKTFASQPIMPMQSMLRLGSAAGSNPASTNTSIRYFTTAIVSQGSDITAGPSVTTLGTALTINTNGVYAISYSDSFSGANQLGISLNSTQLSTIIGSITTADRLASATTVGADYMATVAWTGYLAAGSVIRPHAAPAQAAGTAPSQITIVRVA